MEAKQNTKFVSNKLDPFGIIQSYLEIYQSWLNHPEDWANDYLDFWQLLNKINWQIVKRANNQESDETNIIPNSDNELLNDPIWQENPIADSIKEYYLLANYWLSKKISATKDVADISKKRANFWSQQVLNAFCPANFFALNPRAIMHFLETGGKSISDGLQILADDLTSQDISMVNTSNFKLGENIATTKGKVIFRNDIFELIQYAPITDSVHSMPILIVPPWINKFYILDLNSKKSLIQYLLAQKYTVFIISWRNVPATMRNTTFTDYLMQGILQAIMVSKSICQVEQVHCVGYCVGGTALGTLIAWLNSKQQEVKSNIVAHFTLFCSLFTFEQPGEIDIFIDQNIVAMIEDSMAKLGYLDGKQMGHTFRLLRSNSLIWSYFANSYLLGQAPMAFDVLFWNTDNTRLPEKMHSFYLRNYYLANNLAKKNSLEIKGQKLNLANITQAVYAVGTKQDHITPWKETFKSVALTGGEKRYVLSSSGHIVGIINPPVNPPKREYWVNNLNETDNADTWLDKQQLQRGSWWEDWNLWLTNKCGKLVNPPSMGNQEYKVLGDAPGTYVLE